MFIYIPYLQYLIFPFSPFIIMAFLYETMLVIKTITWPKTNDACLRFYHSMRKACDCEDNWIDNFSLGLKFFMHNMIFTFVCNIVASNCAKMLQTYFQITTFSSYIIYSLLFSLFLALGSIQTSRFELLFNFSFQLIILVFFSNFAEYEHSIFYLSYNLKNLGFSWNDILRFNRTLQRELFALFVYDFLPMISFFRSMSHSLQDNPEESEYKHLIKWFGAYYRKVDTDNWYLLLNTILVSGILYAMHFYLKV